MALYVHRVQQKINAWNPFHGRVSWLHINFIHGQRSRRMEILAAQQIRNRKKFENPWIREIFWWDVFTKYFKNKKYVSTRNFQHSSDLLYLISKIRFHSILLNRIRQHLYYLDLRQTRYQAANLKKVLGKRCTVLSGNKITCLQKPSIIKISLTRRISN